MSFNRIVFREPLVEGGEREGSLIRVLPPEPTKQKPKQWRPRGPFRFLDLPFELREEVLKHLLVLDDTVDLHPDNCRKLAPRLSLFTTNWQLHDEATRVFYGRNTFRIYPTHDRFFFDKEVLLSRLPSSYRHALTSLELRLGPGWTKPPKCWAVNDTMGFKDCTAVRRLRIFVELDPSQDGFKGFRVDTNFYTRFSQSLLHGLLSRMPSISTVEFDAYPSIRKSSELMGALMEEVEEAGKVVAWGKERDWDADQEPEDFDFNALHQRLAALSIRHATAEESQPPFALRQPDQPLHAIETHA
ncbi:hypothetical protein MRB53_040456 [Persea americana]|nr:hypothetical protein MRB53_040456 [Persea americana]